MLITHTQAHTHAHTHTCTHATYTDRHTTHIVPASISSSWSKVSSVMSVKLLLMLASLLSNSALN